MRWRGVVAAAFAGALVPVALAGSSPVVVLDRLDRPGSTATAPDGSVWFTQYPDDENVSLWRLAPEGSSPTQVFAARSDAITSLHVDRKGTAYFVLSVSDGADVVQVDRSGGVTTLYSARSRLGEAGNFVSHIVVSPKGRVYAWIAERNASGGIDAERVVWLREHAPAVDLGRFSDVSLGPMAASDSGVAYVLGTAAGTRTLLELRVGREPREVWEEPASGLAVIPYLALDAAGSLYALRRITTGSPFAACTAPTNYQLLRFAAEGNGVSGTPTVVSEGVFPHFRFQWGGSNEWLRATASGDAYFVSLKPSCPFTAQFTDYQVIHADPDGMRVIDSEAAAPARGAQPYFDLDVAGRLWIAWTARGTLERVDP